MKNNTVGKMVTLQVSLPAEVATFYADTAKAQGLSSSAAMRVALMGYRSAKAGSDANRMVPDGAMQTR